MSSQYFLSLVYYLVVYFLLLLSQLLKLIEWKNLTTGRLTSK
jgi:hypothetical protein